MPEIGQIPLSVIGIQGRSEPTNYLEYQRQGLANQRQRIINMEAIREQAEERTLSDIYRSSVNPQTRTLNNEDFVQKVAQDPVISYTKKESVFQTMMPQVTQDRVNSVVKRYGSNIRGAAEELAKMGHQDEAEKLITTAVPYLQEGLKIKQSILGEAVRIYRATGDWNQAWTWSQNFGIDPAREMPYFSDDETGIKQREEFANQYEEKEKRGIGGLGSFQIKYDEIKRIDLLPNGRMTQILAMEDSPEKDQSIYELQKTQYLEATAPSMMYPLTEEGIRAGVERETRIASARTFAEKAGDLAANKALGLNRINPATGKPFMQSEFLAGTYAVRMQESEDQLNKLQEEGFDAGSVSGWIARMNNINVIKNPKEKRYAQAMRNFINATLRRESGAAIAPHEFESANMQYFGQLGDDPEILEQKRRNRVITYSGFKAESGGAYKLIQEEINRHIRPIKQTSDPNDIDAFFGRDY